MNPNQKALALNQILERCQAQNQGHDNNLLELVAQALATLRERAGALGIDLPELREGHYGASATAVASQFALALVDFQLSLRKECSELTFKQIARVSMADTFLGSAVGFDFRSETHRGRVPHMPMEMSGDELQKFVGEKLAEARKRAGLSQQALADLIGLSNASIARVETGKQNLGMSVLYRFLVALNLHPSEVLPEEAFPAEDEEPPVSREQIQQILEVLPRIEQKLRNWDEQLAAREKRPRPKN